MEFADPALLPVTLEITGRIREALEIEPHYLLVEAFPRERRPAIVTITNRQDRPLRLIGVRSSRPDVTARLEEIETGRKYRLAVDRDPDLAPGAYRGSVELLLQDAPGGRNPVIPLTILVKKKVHVDRGAVVFRAPVISLLVEKHQDPEFQVRNVGCDLPFVAIEQAGPSHQQGITRYEMRFTLREDSRPAAPFRGTVRLETNDPDFPQFTLPVMGPGAAR